MTHPVDKNPSGTGAELRRDSLLRTAEGATATVLAGGEVEVAFAGRTLEGTGELLAALEVFAMGCTLEDGLAKLGRRAAGSCEVIGLTQAVIALTRMGALVQGDASFAPSKSARRNFDRPEYHIGMLNDRVRTGSFIAALRSVVRPGDTVLDIGTGTGVMAVAAAKAGASKVYAIEVGGIAAVARGMVESNGMADRIEVIQDWSARVELPGRCDVLVGEVVGNEPFGESILETFLDARRRLLKPGATLVPNRIRVFGRLVRVPDDQLACLRFGADAAVRWRSWYAMDFSVLPNYNTAMTVHYLLAKEAGELEDFSEPALIADVDLATFEGTSVHSTGTARATSAGHCNAVLVTFELSLAPGIVCSNEPGEAAHWWLLAHLFERVLAVEPGDAVEIEYARNVAGVPNGAHIGKVTRANPGG